MADGQQPLRLRAEDANDLQVISACLQDALTRVADMDWQPRQRRFVLLASRFRWERQQRRRVGGERVRSAFQANHVQAVRLRNVDRRNPEGLLSLLAVVGEERGDGVALHLAFSGGGEIVLEADCFDIGLTDVGSAWVTPHRPRHSLDADDAGA